MNKEYYMKALKAEVYKKELDEILSNAYDNIDRLKYNFYYTDIFISVCMKRLNDEIDCEYFKTWLILASNLLCFNEKHYDISDSLDAWSFADDYNERICRQIIAEIKDYDIKFKHKNYVNYHKKHKLKVIYLRFELIDYSDDDIVYKCYIVDFANKRYDLRFVDEKTLDFDLNKNYCFIRDEEHYKDIRGQEGDDNISIIDVTKPQKQFCEAEEDLQDIFFHDNYKRDKTLQL